HDDTNVWANDEPKAQAAEITEAAQREKPPAIDWCGVVYSSEWGFSKLLHWLRHNPAKRADLASAFEHCDMVAATLCGISDARFVKRSVCAMGHKWMWNDSLGGLPPKAFWSRSIHFSPAFAKNSAALMPLQTRSQANSHRTGPNSSDSLPAFRYPSALSTLIGMPLAPVAAARTWSMSLARRPASSASRRRPISCPVFAGS